MLQASPSSYEWLKILFSTLAGLAAGLLAEPIKASIQTRLVVRQIRHVLHRELVRLEAILDFGSACSDESLKDGWASYKVEGYEHYLETQRGLFYSNDSLSRMRSVIEELKEYLADPLNGRRELSDAKVCAKGLIQDVVTLEIFDKALVEKYRKMEKDYGTMMVFAGIGKATNNDILPKRKLRFPRREPKRQTLG